MLLGLALASSCGDGDSRADAGEPDGEVGIATVGPVSTGDTGASDEADELETLYLRIEPRELVLEVELGVEASIPYHAIAVRSDGTEQDVSDEVSWSLEGSVIASFVGSTLQIPASDEGTVASAVITAELPMTSGQTQVTLAQYELEEDFFFVLPFGDDGGEQARPLRFDTEVKSMDVLINMDTTASMDAALANLQAALSTTIIPRIRELVPDTHFGAGAFQDFPLAPHGIPGDQPFFLYQPVTSEVDAVQAALESFSMGDGGDAPESLLEALYQIATGEGLDGPGGTLVLPYHEGVGGAGFREGALPVVVSITNAISHDPDGTSCGRPYQGEVADVAHGGQQTFAALEAICARTIHVGLSGGVCAPSLDGEALAQATGTLIPPAAWDVVGRPPQCGPGQCCTGPEGAGVEPGPGGSCPMSFRASLDGTGVDESFASAVELVAAYERFSVTREVVGETADLQGQPLPGGTTTADFIRAVRPLEHGPSPLPGVPDPTLGPESFDGVIPATEVTFEVRAYNDFVEAEQEPRVFRARIEVFADGCSALDQRDVLVLVPPAPLPPPG